MLKLYVILTEEEIKIESVQKEAAKVNVLGWE
jgi:hypothetical protein